MKKALIFASFILILVVLLSLGLRPVPIIPEVEALVVTGTVTEVKEGGTNDIILTLTDINQNFYINRGLEKGFSISSLNNKLLGQEVEIKYPEYWTPLDPINSIRHISQLTADGVVIFNELKK